MDRKQILVAPQTLQKVYIECDYSNESVHSTESYTKIVNEKKTNTNIAQELTHHNRLIYFTEICIHYFNVTLVLQIFE